MRTENGHPPVSPGRQAIRGKPVNARVTSTPIAFQQDFPEILKVRAVGIGHIPDMRSDDASLGRSGEVQELIELMGTDVGQNSTIAQPLPKPVSAE